MRIELSISAMLCLLLPLSSAQAEEPVPDDFPKFIAPGHEEAMETLRELYFLHYNRRLTVSD